MTPSPRVWVLADDRAGNVGQCLGVAEALGLAFTVKDIRYDRWARLPNALRGASLLGVAATTRDQLTPPWPDLVIAAGRRTAPVARWLKRRNPAVRLVQIMDPGPGGRGDFDLIVVPRHDGRGNAANMLAITGAPHRVTEAKLAEAATLWQERFAALPRPWVAAIVGGDTRKRRFGADLASELGRRCTALATGGSVLVTTSRRTSAEAEAALLAAIPEPRFVHRWSAGGDNPYFGFLALADAVVVTGDSVSMACEACARSGPVYLYAPPGWAVDKHARLHDELYLQGYARPLPEQGDGEAWSHPRLNPAAVVATAIRETLL